MALNGFLDFFQKGKVGGVLRDSNVNNFLLKYFGFFISININIS